MKTSTEYQPNLSFGLLLKGAPKTGKTVVSLMFPNPYIADCDNNLGGAVRLIRERFPDKEFRYDTICVADNGTLVPEAARWSRLVSCCTAAAKDPWVKTIIVDSAATMSDMLIAHIINEKDSGKDKDKMTIGDWIPFRNMVTKFVTTFRSVGKFFIMTAHELAEKDDGTGQIIYKPHIPSKLQDNFGGFFSDEWLCVAETTGGEIRRTVKTAPDPRRPLGSSLNLPLEFVFEWDKFAARLDKYNNQLKG
jgi:hypothetical protein